MLALLSAGSNAQGQLGVGDLNDSHIFQKCSFKGYPSGTLPTGTSRIIDVATGANHTIVLIELEDISQTHMRELWGCGDGRKGQLGPQLRDCTGDDDPCGLFKRIVLPLNDLDLQEYHLKSVSATWETTYIALSCQSQGSSDIIVTMGADDFGDLGIGGRSLAQSVKGVHVPQLQHLFWELDGAGTITIDHISTGQRHVILHLTVLRPDSSPRREVVGWGTSRHGQLGITVSSQSKPPPFIPIPTIVTLPYPEDEPIASSLGIHHSVFIHASGRTTALGSDRKSQLRVISDSESVQQIVCTWNGSYIVRQDSSGWSVISSGSNSHGQLGWNSASSESAVGVIRFGDVDPTTASIRLASGSEHVLALIVQRDSTTGQVNSEVWGWGWNEHGNLGLGHTTDVSVPARIWQQAKRMVVREIWGGCGTSWLCCEYADH